MDGPTRERLLSIAPLVFLIVLVLAFFPGIVFLGKTFYLKDLTSLYFPARYLAIETWARGELPLWNPHSYLGFPLLASAGTSVLYPLNVFYLLPFSFPANASWFIIAHYWIAAVSMYFLGRAMGMGRLGSVMAAMTFTFSGFMVSRAGHLNIITAAAWLPAMFYMNLRFFRTGKVLYAFALVPLVSLQILTSHPQILAYSQVALILFAGFEAFNKYRVLGMREGAKSFAIVIVVVFWGFLIATVQLLPTYELKELSQRSGAVPYFTRYSVPPWHLLGTIFPYFFGRPDVDTYIGSANFYELYQYSGLLPLIFASLAWMSPTHRLRVGFFYFLGMMALLLSLGHYFPPYQFFRFVPIFNAFGVPARWFLLVALSLSVLAGFGLHSMIHLNEASPYLKKLQRIFTLKNVVAFALLGTVLAFGLETHVAHGIEEAFFSLLLGGRRPVFVENLVGGRYPLLSSVAVFVSSLTVVFLLFWLFLTRKLGVRLFAGLVVLLGAADLFYGGITINSVREPTYFLRAPNWTQFIQQDGGTFRIFPTFGGPWRNEPSIHFNFDFPLLFGLSSVDGRSVLTQERYDRLSEKLEHGDTRAGDYFLDTRLLGLLNVKYVTSADPLENVDLEEVHRDHGEMVNFAGDKVRYSFYLYRNQRFMPRAFGVFDVQYAESPDQALEALVDPSFDPLRKVILEERPPRLMNSSGAGEALVEIRSLSAQKIEVIARFPRDGFLVLSNSYYPGWKVFVDGMEDKTWRVNYLLQGAYVTSGNHTITFVFDSVTVKVGAILSASAFIVYLLALSVYLAKRRISD